MEKKREKEKGKKIEREQTRDGKSTCMDCIGCKVYLLLNENLI